MTPPPIGGRPRRPNTTRPSDWRGKPSRSPSSPSRSAGLGWLEARQGQRAECIAHLAESAQLCDARQIHLFRAWCHAGLGDLEAGRGVDRGCAAALSRRWSGILQAHDIAMSICRLIRNGSIYCFGWVAERRRGRWRSPMPSAPGRRVSRGRWPGRERCAGGDRRAAEVDHAICRGAWPCTGKLLMSSSERELIWRRVFGCAGSAGEATPGRRYGRPSPTSTRVGAVPFAELAAARVARDRRAGPSVGGRAPRSSSPRRNCKSPPCWRPAAAPGRPRRRCSSARRRWNTTCGTSTRNWMCTAGMNWRLGLAE